MAVVQRPPTTSETPGQLDPADADLLFREAKQRERRRRLLWLGVAVIVVGGAVALVAATTTPKAPPHHAKISIPSVPKPPSPLPTGSIVALKIAGPLAVGPTGSLYVVDEPQHEVVVRLSNGEFSDVAGDGRAGFSGDGGLATKAELSSVSAMSFGPNGDLYLADGTRVRVVESNGTIHTIAGDGHSGSSVANGTPALSASLGPVVALTFSPSGQLYFATSTQIFRLASANTLKTVRVIATLYGGKKVAANEYGSIAVDAKENVFASAAFPVWSIYKITPDGVATYLGYAFRSGGNTAIVQRSADGTIEADDGPYIQQVEGNRLVSTAGFNDVPGIAKFNSLDYFALAPNGTIYADNVPSSAFDPYQQIVSLSLESGQGASLWHGASGT